MAVKYRMPTTNVNPIKIKLNFTNAFYIDPVKMDALKAF